MKKPRKWKMWAVVEDSGKWFRRRADLYDTKREAYDELRERKISNWYSRWKWRVTRVEVRELSRRQSRSKHGKRKTR